MNTLELEEGEIGHLENDEACNVQGLYYDVWQLWVAFAGCKVYIWTSTKFVINNIFSNHIEVHAKSTPQRLFIYTSSIPYCKTSNFLHLSALQKYTQHMTTNSCILTSFLIIKIVSTLTLNHCKNILKKQK
jgi:hypothetical protein